MADTSEVRQIMGSTLLLMPTCGNCAFAETTPDLAVIICHGVPPTPCVVGGQQTITGMQFNVEMMVPRLPRVTKACALWRQRASDIN